VTERLGADTAGIARAAALLRSGALVAFGTETVYGLGADAGDERAVARVFDAKGRPHFNPLICHYPDAASAFADVAADERALALADAFWPGPLTMVLARRASCRVALLAGAGLSTVAVRVPVGRAVTALLEAVGRPVAAPSANRSGRISPTNAAHVLEELDGRIAAVLDTGDCAVGLESSVVDLTGAAPFLLRPGGVAAERIEAVVGRLGRGITPGAAEAARGLRSPGLMVSHYAPELPVRLGAARAEADEALLGFGRDGSDAAVSWNLSERGDLVEAASRLFSGLRFLDAEGRRLGLSRIAAMEVPASGLGLAIRDRLERAASPRTG
jgi:L-threonylcarbamoyladenylate synthase